MTWPCYFDDLNLNQSINCCFVMSVAADSVTVAITVAINDAITDAESVDYYWWMEHSIMEPSDPYDCSRMGIAGHQVLFEGSWPSDSSTCSFDSPFPSQSCPASSGTAARPCHS